MLGRFRRHAGRTYRGSLLLALGVAPALGCLPDPVDVTGKRCDAEQSCGPGFLCQDGRCSRDDASPSPPTNLVRNSGFEEGTEGWEATGALSTESPGFSGAFAARLMPRGDGAPATLTPRAPPLRDSADSYYCASAWVRGGPGHTVALELLEGAEVQETAALPLDGTWRQVTVTTLFLARAVGTVRLVIPADVASPVWVDEVQLWRSDSVFCEDGP